MTRKPGLGYGLMQLIPPGAYWPAPAGSTEPVDTAETELHLGAIRAYRWWTLAAPVLDEWPVPEVADAWDPGWLQATNGTDWLPGVNTATCTVTYAAHPAADIPASTCGCVVPGTRILTAGLQWVPAGDLEVGDRLVAFDEYPAEPGFQKQGGRKYREAEVASVDRDRLPCWDLEFNDGTKVRVSSDHRWLCTAGLDGAHWVEAIEMRRGDLRATHVVKPFTPWKTDSSWEAGYLAAAFDGEGCLFQHKSRYQFQVAFTQAESPMLAEVERCLKELGFEFVHSVALRGYNKPLRVDGSPRLDMHRLTISRREDWLRFMGAVRPFRLLPKFRPDVLGRLNLRNQVRLVGKTFAGYQEVVKLGTTSGTYFAEGLCSHNCGFWAYWQPQHHALPPGRLPVFGAIDATGTVEIAEYGLRAARAEIVALHLPLTIGPRLPQDRSRGGTPSGDLGTALGRHLRFTGKVYNYGITKPPPPPEPNREETAEAELRGEAWLAVIGDRLRQLYPAAEVCESRDLLIASYPPDAVYGNMTACQWCRQAGLPYGHQFTCPANPFRGHQIV